ncbi:MAG: hypothetical protein AB7R89_34900 [Dehalococcoidia bacterium]
MSAELSRRLARVAHHPPVKGLPRGERHALWLACERGTNFSDLSEHYQRLILEADAARERAIAAQRRFIAS